LAQFILDKFPLSLLLLGNIGKLFKVLPKVRAVELPQCHWQFLLGAVVSLTDIHSCHDSVACLWLEKYELRISIKSIAIVDSKSRNKQSGN
jgi:hypothetical protein